MLARRFKTEILGVNLVFSYLAIAQLTNQSCGAETDLIHPISAKYDNGVLRPKALQNTDLNPNEVWVENPH